MPFLISHFSSHCMHLSFHLLRQKLIWGGKQMCHTINNPMVQVYQSIEVPKILKLSIGSFGVKEPRHSEIDSAKN